jgi:hypothetical protein
MNLRTVPLFAAAAVACGVANASSHREAPFIAAMPKVDATDFYLFRSYEAQRYGYVTFIANYQPLQAPYGGPNFFDLDNDALYEIHVDNDGDAVEDLTFQFRFRRIFANIALPVGAPGEEVNTSIPLVNAGPVGPGRRDLAAVNVRQEYTLGVIRGPRRASAPVLATAAGTSSTRFLKPVDNIGEKSIPDYPAYAQQHVYAVDIPGCKRNGRVFVGQRREGFAVDLGGIFDLVNTNPVGPPDASPNALAGFNVTSLALEVPVGCVARPDQPVIGAWTTASLPRTRELRDDPRLNRPTVDSGDYVQVSRLGMPLVNEVVIGLPDKDRFNASQPKDDAQFAHYVTNPSLPALLQALFNVPAPSNFPRTDLVAAFLTGVPGLNQPANVKASEMLRLNTSIEPVRPAQQKNLGLLDGDNAGFPNGRRPGDDVVDAELRVAMGVVCHAFPGVFCTPQDAPAGTAALTDGVTVHASDFDRVFPYLQAPLPGARIVGSN